MEITNSVMKFRISYSPFFNSRCTTAGQMGGPAGQLPGALRRH